MSFMIEEIEKDLRCALHGTGVFPCPEVLRMVAYRIYNGFDTFPEVIDYLLVGAGQEPRYGRSQLEEQDRLNRARLKLMQEMMELNPLARITLPARTHEEQQTILALAQNGVLTHNEVREAFDVPLVPSDFEEAIAYNREQMAAAVAVPREALGNRNATVTAQLAEENARHMRRILEEQEARARKFMDDIYGDGYMEACDQERQERQQQEMNATMMRKVMETQEEKESCKPEPPEGWLDERIKSRRMFSNYAEYEKERNAAIAKAQQEKEPPRLLSAAGKRQIRVK